MHQCKSIKGPEIDKECELQMNARELPTDKQISVFREGVSFQRGLLHRLLTVFVIVA